MYLHLFIGEMNGGRGISIGGMSGEKGYIYMWWNVWREGGVYMFTGKLGYYCM